MSLTAKCGLHSMEIAEKVYVNLTKSDVRDMIMEKVYDVTEPTIQSKNEMQDQIDELKRSMKDMQELILSKHDSFESAIDIETGKDLKKATPQELLERDKMINDRMVRDVGEWDSRMKVKVK